MQKVRAFMGFPATNQHEYIPTGKRSKQKTFDEEICECTNPMQPLFPDFVIMSPKHSH